MKNIRLITIFLGLVLSSCANILSGSNYKIHLNSNVDNVHYVVKDNKERVVFSGFTPDSVILSSYQGYFNKPYYTFEVKYEGFLDETYRLNYEVSKNYYLNIPTLNIIGLWIVDPKTGAMWKPIVDSIYFDMKN